MGSMGRPSNWGAFRSKGYAIKIYFIASQDHLAMTKTKGDRIPGALEQTTARPQG